MPGIRGGHIVTSADLTDSLGRIVVKQTTETVTSNTTLQNDDELVIAAESNTAYLMDGYFIYQATTTSDIKITFTGPSGATMTWSAFAPNAAASPATDYDATANGLTVTRALAGNGAGALMAMAVRGYLSIGGTAGSLQLQWAQNTSGSPGTSINAGSWMRLFKVV